jgi:hypothetical protein
MSSEASWNKKRDDKKEIETLTTNQRRKMRWRSCARFLESQTGNSGEKWTQTPAEAKGYWSLSVGNKAGTWVCCEVKRSTGATEAEAPHIQSWKLSRFQKLSRKIQPWVVFKFRGRDR